MIENPCPQLTSLDSLENAAREKALPARITQLLQEADAVARAPEQAAVLRTLAAAIQLDLAFLYEYPEELFTALFMRCALYDNSAGGWLGAPGSRAATCGGLSALAQRWHEEYVQRGRTWVQTLLPPEYLPGGPLLAECGLLGHSYLLGISAAGDVYFADGWNAATSKRTRWCVLTGELSPTREILENAARIPDSLRVVLKAWTSATLYDDAKGSAHPLDIPAGASPATYRFSADGALLAVAGCEDEYAGGFVHVYETATARLLHSFHGALSSWSMLTFTPDGRLLLAANEEGVHLWELTPAPAKPEAAEFYPMGPQCQASLSPDGTRLVVFKLGGRVQLFDLAALRARKKAPQRRPNFLLFSPDGSRLLNGTWLCDGYTGRRQRRLSFPCPEYPEDGVTRNSLHFGSARIIYLTADVRVWDTATGKSIRNWYNGPHEHYSTDDLIAFAHDGRSYAVSVNGKSPLRVIDADTGMARATLAVDGVTALAFSLDGRLLASGTDKGEVVIWDVPGGAPVASLPRHRGAIAALGFSLDGQLLVSAAYDEALRVSQVGSGVMVATRPLDKNDSTYQRPCWAKINPYPIQRTWYATIEALRKLTQWVGFATAPAPRYHIGVGGVALCILDSQTGGVLARFPRTAGLTAHPTAASWAGPFVHLQLRTPT